MHKYVNMKKPISAYTACQIEMAHIQHIFFTSE